MANKAPPVHDKTKKFVVVCIDFGTSGTGYSCVFTNDPDNKIYTETIWPDAPIPYAKTLTQILYSIREIVDSSGKIIKVEYKPIEYGHSASKKYYELDSAVIKDYSLLSNFKLGLFENSSGEITDPINGRKFNVVNVIADYLKFIWGVIKNKFINISTRTINESDIRLCITVPAIWSDHAKMVMKEAVKLAGILPIGRDPTEDECIIVLEPEAASAYCVKQLNNTESLKEGDVFMIVDAGGGTVDLTVHKLEKNKLKEVCARGGGVCGSSQINENFWNLLKVHFTDLERFKNEKPADYCQLMYEWEKAKCNITTLEIARPVPANEFHSFAETAIKTGSTIYNKNGRKLKLEAKELQEIFNETLNKILDLISSQLIESTQKVDYIILVGGFGRSQVLVNTVSTRFKNEVKKIISPTYASEAILYGGALLGLDPSLIKSRKAKLSYGIEVRGDFNDGSDEKRLIFEESKFLEKGVYLPFVLVNQDVEIDETTSHQFVYDSQTPKIMEITIYCSLKKNIKYVDQLPFINKVGKLEVNLPPPDKSKGKAFVTVIMYFGKIDLKVEAIDFNGTKCETKLKFEAFY